jgi:hypothetical protein
LTDQQLEILHDHYKDSFTQVREREKQRDRLFLILLALLALLSAMVLYYSSMTQVLGSITVAGTRVNLVALPAPALLTSVWVFVLAIALRYCQISLTVERQYSYVHMLEEKLSEAVGDDDLYRREGRAYLHDYPAFSDWAWISYIYVFPAIMTLATLGLLTMEWIRFPSGWPFKVFDSGLGTAVTLTLFLYRGWPLIQGKRKDVNTSPQGEAFGADEQ